MTSDIQDFKSSFKQTVSGGLRAAAQIVGCAVSLVMISPHMTLISLMCIPAVIGVGTAFGALLRSTSSKAQAQVCFYYFVIVKKITFKDIKVFVKLLFIVK